MIQLIFGITLLIAGVICTTIGGFVATDGWNKLKKQKQTEIQLKPRINVTFDKIKDDLVLEHLWESPGHPYYNYKIIVSNDGKTSAKELVFGTGIISHEKAMNYSGINYDDIAFYESGYPKIIEPNSTVSAFISSKYRENDKATQNVSTVPQIMGIKIVVKYKEEMSEINKEVHLIYAVFGKRALILSRREIEVK